MKPSFSILAYTTNRGITKTESIVMIFFALLIGLYAVSTHKVMQRRIGEMKEVQVYVLEK